MIKRNYLIPENIVARYKNVVKETNVNKGQPHIINDVSFDFEAGIITGFVGEHRNGCEELVKLLLGKTSFDDGSIAFGEYVLYGNKKVDHSYEDNTINHVQLVDRNLRHNVLIDATVEENIIADSLESKYFHKKLRSKIHDLEFELNPTWDAYKKVTNFDIRREYVRSLNDIPERDQFLAEQEKIEEHEKKFLIKRAQAQLKINIEILDVCAESVLNHDEEKVFDVFTSLLKSMMDFFRNELRYYTEFLNNLENPQNKLDTRAKQRITADTKEEVKKIIDHIQVMVKEHAELAKDKHSYFNGVKHMLTNYEDMKSEFLDKLVEAKYNWIIHSYIGHFEKKSKQHLEDTLAAFDEKEQENFLEMARKKVNYMRINQERFEILELLEDKANLYYNAVTKMTNICEVLDLDIELIHEPYLKLDYVDRIRVSLARKLMYSPKILIIDNIVSGADLSTKAMILTAIKAAHEAKLVETIFYVDSDLRNMKFLVDKIAIMYKGNIIEYGQTRSVLNSPSHLYTQALIQSIPTIYGNFQDILRSDFNFVIASYNVWKQPSWQEVNENHKVYCTAEDYEIWRERYEHSGQKRQIH